MNDRPVSSQLQRIEDGLDMLLQSHAALESSVRSDLAKLTLIAESLYRGSAETLERLRAKPRKKPKSKAKRRK